MTSIDIELPDEMNEYVEKQAIERGYSRPMDFIVALLEEHKRKQSRSEIEAMLLERIDGPFQDWTDRDLEDVRNEGTALVNQRKRA